MLLVYALISAGILSTFLYVYGGMAEHRHPNTNTLKRKEYPDMWIKGLLDCEYSPAKQAYGPARVLPVSRVRKESTS